MGQPEWEWDASLYAGSAAYYAKGRVPYPDELVEVLTLQLGLDGRGRLLDVGCGPGSLTLLLAPLFEQVTAVDADAGMVDEGRRRAESAGIANVTWVQGRAEELSHDLGPFRLVTMAQSFHWMDQAAVAPVLHSLLDPGGALAQVHASTHRGIDGTTPLPHPRPPRDEIEALVERYVGSRRRAGQGYRTDAMGREEEREEREAAIFRAAGFGELTRVEIQRGVVTRTTDEVVASVFSLSYAAPHLFGERAQSFEADLRALLDQASPDGLFSEQMREIAVDIWRA